MAQRFYWKQYVTDKQVTFYIADLVLKPGEQIEAHCHDYYEFFVVLKGTFLERCNGQELVMQPGMGQLLGPDEGLYLAVKRILRCHPWGGSGYDPVP